MAVASLQVTKTYADGLAWTEARMDTAMQSIQTYTQTSLVNNFNQIIKDAFSATYTLDNDGSTNLPTPVKSIAITASLNNQQIRKDVFGATYTLDGDGAANNTNTLYKEVWGRSYTGNLPRKLYTELFGNDASSTARSKSLYAEAFGASPSTIAVVRNNSLYNKQSASRSYNTTITLSAAVGAWTEASTGLRILFSPEATGKYNLNWDFTVNHNFSTVDGISRVWYGIFNQTAGATLVAKRVAFIQTGRTNEAHSVPVSLNYIHNFTSTAAASFTLKYRTVSSSNFTGHSMFCAATGKNGIYGAIHKI